MWLDYIKTLNERSLQAAQRSGATTYVLLAALAALIFKFAPRVPQFLSDGQELRTGAVLLMFELDAVIFFGFVQFLLFMYAEDVSPSRLAPESNKRHLILSYVVSASTVAAVITLHVAVLAKCDLLGKFVRIVVWVLLVWWLLNFAVPLAREVRLILKARAHNVPIPRFRSDVLPSGWPRLVGAAAYLTILALVSVALIIYCSRLGDHWVRPAKAAALLLASFAILAYTFFRGATKIAREQYFGLERDILLLQLDAQAIKIRFERELIGLDIAHWLDELVGQLNHSNAGLIEKCSSFRQRFESIKQIEAEYADARILRFSQLLDEIDKEFNAHEKAFSEFDFKLNIFLDGYKNPRDVEIISGWKEKYQKARGLTLETMEVRGRLISEMKQYIQEQKSG
jgi:hypothetical protein